MLASNTQMNIDILSEKSGYSAIAPFKFIASLVNNIPHAKNCIIKRFNENSIFLRIKLRISWSMMLVVAYNLRNYVAHGIYDSYRGFWVPFVHEISIIIKAFLCIFFYSIENQYSQALINISAFELYSTFNYSDIIQNISILRNFIFVFQKFSGEKWERGLFFLRIQRCVGDGYSCQCEKAPERASGKAEPIRRGCILGNRDRDRSKTPRQNAAVQRARRKQNYRVSPTILGHIRPPLSATVPARGA